MQKSAQGFWVVVWFLGLGLQGATLGLSDDEAYYWVLSQKWAWAYAYHPPAVAILIRWAEGSWGWLLGAQAPELLVRLPAILCSTLLLILTLEWWAELEISRVAPRSAFEKVSWVLSFACVFAFSWMMVPDLPLFLGWMLLVTGTWKTVFPVKAVRSAPGFRWQEGVRLFLGTALVLLSKYSGVLAVGSALLCLLASGFRKRSLRSRLLSLPVGCVLLGAVLGVLPTLLWNASHEWASILYQIRDRHQGHGLGFSWKRGLTFWGAQLLLASPWVLIEWTRRLQAGVRRSQALSSADLFFLAWILPVSAVFCVQPFFSDFKLHWAVVVWWPVFLGGIHRLSRQPGSLPWAPRVYGALLTVILMGATHWPVASWMAGTSGSAQIQPGKDVTNDFFSWQGLAEQMQAAGIETEVPIVGSRYQTASQARFYLRAWPVTLLPRGIKEKDEWPDYSAWTPPSGAQSGWPQLKSKVYFLSDNRFTSGPEFPGAHCDHRERFQQFRKGQLAHWVDLWECQPIL
jgi:hypothetical protein